MLSGGSLLVLLSRRVPQVEAMVASFRERKRQEVKEERLWACLDRDCLLELVLVEQ